MNVEQVSLGRYERQSGTCMERKMAYSLLGEEGSLGKSFHNIGVVFLENYEGNLGMNP